MRYIIEVKVRVQNCTKHFEAREEILGEYYDHLNEKDKSVMLALSVDELRNSLLPEIQKAQG